MSIVNSSENETGAAKKKGAGSSDLYSLQSYYNDVNLYY